jgi:hypothetical protein
MTTVAAVVALEVAEMRAMADLYRSASGDLIVASGLSATELDGSILIAANRIDVLALNRVIGLGLAAPPSDAVLANVVRAFEEIGSQRFFVPLAPVEENEKLDLRLEALGMRRYNNWMRLWRDQGRTIVSESPPPRL